MKKILPIIAVMAGLASPAWADSAPDSLKSAVKEWMAHKHPEADSVDVARYFVKNDIPRAAVVLDFETRDGGNALTRAALVFEKSADGWRPVGEFKVFGGIVSGKLENEHTLVVYKQVLQPNDARCCPTGKEMQIIKLP